MKTTKVLILPLAASLLLAGSACGTAKPQPITEKRIDPETRTCAKKKQFVCTKWKTDDKDWVLITSDGVEHDVDESEYNSVKVGDMWSAGN